MKKSVHPALIAGTIVAVVALVAFAFLKMGTGTSATPSAVASPYGFGPGQKMEMPPNAGSGVNSITGEPLTPTGIAAEQESYARLTGERPANMPPPGTDLSRTPTPPKP